MQQFNEDNARLKELRDIGIKKFFALNIILLYDEIYRLVKRKILKYIGYYICYYYTRDVAYFRLFLAKLNGSCRDSGMK